MPAGNGLQPFVHLLARKTPLSLLTAEQAASAVDGRIEGRLGLGAIYALDNHGVVAHRAADKAALTGERRCRALANDPKIASVVVLRPFAVAMAGSGEFDPFKD
jgi:hypothetical protein